MGLGLGVGVGVGVGVGLRIIKAGGYLALALAGAEHGHVRHRVAQAVAELEVNAHEGADVCGGLRGRG